MKKLWLGLLAIPLVHSAALGEANPYAVIANRNVFQLKPAVETPPPVELPPPAKITLLGIVVSFGSKQVMFRTTVGTPPKQVSYVLSEGERADELLIMEIDQNKGMVRIDNSGTEQWLSMEKDALKPSAVASGANIVAMETRHGIPKPVRPRPAVVPTTPAMSSDEQMILMEINRKLNADRVSKGMMPPMPDTPLTGQ